MSNISNDLRERALAEVTTCYAKQGLRPERAFSEEILGIALGSARDLLAQKASPSVSDLSPRLVAMQQRLQVRQQDFAVGMAKGTLGRVGLSDGVITEIIAKLKP